MKIILIAKFVFLNLCCFSRYVKVAAVNNETQYDIYFDVAKKKCSEFSKIQEDAPIAVARGLSMGLHHVRSQCDLLGTPLIVGGTRAKFGEFPHQAELGYSKRGEAMRLVRWVCGGSLITERFVLTAAHCVKTDLGRPRYVRFGLTTKLSYSVTDNIFSVRRSIPHPRFSPVTRGLYDDIGLVELARTVDFSETLKPVCLNTRHDITSDRAIASGFGKLTFHDTSESLRLMKVTLDVIDRKTCSSLESALISSQVCATVMSGGKDTCQGDSGGPLQIIQPHPLCMYSIIGITSYGRQCGHANTPAVYTRVSYYIPWIVHTVWGRLVGGTDLDTALGYKRAELEADEASKRKTSFLSEWK